MNLMKMMKSSRRPALISVTETRDGIRTSVSGALESMPSAHKAQVRAFLEDIIRRMK